MGIAGWNPAWYRSGESLISLALKVAYGNSTTVGAVLERLVGAAASNRLPTMFPDFATAERVCKTLELPAGVATTMFVGVGKPSLRIRERACLALRWCPSCFFERYHAWDFHDWTNGTCRAHGDRLLDWCPRCCRHVDPLMLSGWHCPVCSHPFATDLHSDWPRALRRATSAERTSETMPRCGADIKVEQGAQGLVVSCIGTLGRQESNLQQWAYSREAAVIRRHAWEQCSAVVDCLYGDHQACIRPEWSASHLEFGVTNFECPLGAAVAQTLAWLGCTHERCMGWPDSTFDGSNALPVLWHAVSRAPSWLRTTLVREATKEWLSDAIAQFASVDVCAPARLSWRPPEHLGMRWKCSERKALIETGPTGKKLRANAANGARACRVRGSAQTGSLTG